MSEKEGKKCSKCHFNVFFCARNSNRHISRLRKSYKVWIFAFQTFLTIFSGKNYLGHQSYSGLGLSMTFVFLMKLKLKEWTYVVMSFPGLLLRAHVRASAEFHPKTFSKQSKFFRDFTPSENNQNHVLY